MSDKNKHKGFKLLQWAAILVFIGRAYQHLFWDAPYREVLWDPTWTGWLVHLFSDLSWGEYVTHPMGDIWIQRLVIAQGFFFLLCAVAAMFIKRIPKWGRGLLLLGAIDLIILAIIYTKDHFFHLGQFFEYALQFGTPIFLYYYLKNGEANKQFIFAIKITIALTFACHGLYAIGYYPIPGSFLSMSENILGLTSTGAEQFLKVVGILDFIVAAGIFLPYKWARWILAYAVLWGLLTTMARIAGNFYFDYPVESLHQWVYQAVFRAPHFLVPLWLYRRGIVR